MNEANKPYESEAEKEAATKPAPVPETPDEETEHARDNGDPLGSNVA